MRPLANFYIFVFFADGGLSLLGELTSGLPAAALVAPARLLTAGLVMLLSMVLFACLGIDRRLPKIVFLPLTIYPAWAALALWPLSAVIDRELLGLTAATGQLLLGGLALLLLRRRDGQWLLSERRFQAPMFSLRNTLGFTAINLLLLPFLLVYGGLATAGHYLDQQTAGFLRVSPLGIYMTERSYHRGSKVVRLAAMMHIGRQDYYRELSSALSTNDTIVLSEGVTDRDRLLKQQFRYSELAGIIGLSSQESMLVDGNPVDLTNLDREHRPAARSGKPDIARADIDLNRFDPQTIEFLNVLGRTLFGSRPLLQGLIEYQAWVEANMSPQRLAGVMADLIDKRNAAVIDGMVRSLKHYDTVVIPWGAMHMPAIEAAVIEQGFSPGEKHERLSVDFTTISYAELWRKWSAQ